ncbi:MAG: hypothetical protein DHS20C13_24870 [Thermodesulfobacteriota bacterium]|nr:MAG: hypothetical protein DHS20C13_24870 [Thermodesulfobacteriota bacterium]
MADLLGKIKGKIDKGISTVNLKSKELIEKQKLKLQKSELEAEKRNILLELGKLTHLIIESSDGEDDLISTKTTETKKSKELKPDKWEQSVLSILNSICKGELDNILFENTNKEFKITAKSLFAEVQKSLPKSEQKGQNLQWLGRVLGKFGITSRKYSKRINRERETVYEFDKQETRASLSKVKNNKTKTNKEQKSTNYKDQTLLKSNEIKTLDAKIAKLEKQLSEIGT